MARRGRKPKKSEPKEFLFANDPKYKGVVQKKDSPRKGLVNSPKTNLFSSAAKFMNIFPKGEKEFYMTPVKKGERLGYGKYRIEAHYPNSKSDDRENYLNDREGKDAFFKNSKTTGDNSLTIPRKIKYDGIQGIGYHLVTHDRDGKRVEFMLTKPGIRGNGNFGATIQAEMYLPDISRTRAKKGEDGNKLQHCPVTVGSMNISASKKGKMKFTKSKPKGECSKYGYTNSAKHDKDAKPLNPKEYETGYKAAEGQETFLTEEELIYFYAMSGEDIDMSVYQPIDSVEVDRTSYQPAQNYGAEYDQEVILCRNCGSSSIGGEIVQECVCKGAESATYEPSSEPDMVNSIATEPTNAEADLFGSQGYNDKMDESMGMRDGTEGSMEQSMKDRRDEASAMDRRGRMGRKYDDVMTMDAESKNKWVKGKDGKTYVLRKKTGRMVTHNAESPGGAYPTLEDFNGMESVVVEPALGHGVAQWYAEGSSATYEPSSEPDMESPATEPTNANFEADINYDAKIRLNNPKDAKYITPSIEEGMFFEEGEGILNSNAKIDLNAETDNGKEWTIIVYEYKDGMHSYAEQVVQRGKITNEELQNEVEEMNEEDGGERITSAYIRGHLTADEWNTANRLNLTAEGDSATYSPSSNPDMVNEIQTEPTNANADLFGSETLAEIEGPTAEATAGGLHSPSSFDISWEDGNGMSSASMPPNEIAWAENKETYCAGCKAAESGCHCSEGYSAESLADYETIDSVEVDRTSYQPTQDYGSEFEGEFTDDMKKGAAYGIGAYAGWAFIGTAAVLALELLGRKMGE